MAPLLEVRGLEKHYVAEGGTRVTAAAEIDLVLGRGETLGLVGESGSGKSTVARCILRLEDPTAGRVFFDGLEITRLTPRALRPLRRRFQILFQDPVASLNPRLTVGATVQEPLVAHRLVPQAQRAERCLELLAQVGLHQELLPRFPHELSAGQRQRLCIARALAVSPELVVADEPVSSLDASVQAQVVNLLCDLQKDLGLSYLFISHDLRLVRHLSHRVAVMYRGRIVEEGPAEAVYASPTHPYTRALHDATPRLSGEPSAVHTPVQRPATTGASAGCPYYPRCPSAEPQCLHQHPELHEFTPGHRVRCRAFLGSTGARRERPQRLAKSTPIVPASPINELRRDPSDGEAQTPPSPPPSGAQKGRSKR